jgi:iron complex transport system substrate-binding protein
MTVVGTTAARAALPKIASINLCTDQLVLSVADPSQILSLSWLAAHPEESMLAATAAAYPLNYGSAEELLRLDPDVVIAGSETSPFTRELIRRLGTTVVEISAANSIADIARNLEQVGTAIGREAETRAVIAALHTLVADLRARRAEPAHRAIVVRPGGFTIGRGTLAFELLGLAGLVNSIAELDAWGSLTIETLVTTQSEYLVLTRYREDQPSLANAFFAHPALASIASEQRRISVHARFFACGIPQSLQAVEDLLAQMAEP